MVGASRCACSITQGCSGDWRRKLCAYLVGAAAGGVKEALSAGSRRRRITVPKAKTGELAIMGGGADGAVERALPILETMGQRIFRTGALGTAQAMKALNNLVSAAGMVASMEALLVGKKFGLDPARWSMCSTVRRGETTRRNISSNSSCSPARMGPGSAWIYSSKT